MAISKSLLRVSEIESYCFDAGVGVYEIYNPSTGKSYVGASWNSISKRWRQHINLLKKGKHSNSRLQKDWNTHGSEIFEFKILEKLHTEEECRIAEGKWMHRKGIYGGVYNINHSEPAYEISSEFKNYLIKVLESKANSIPLPVNTYISSDFRNYLVGILFGKSEEILITVHRPLQPQSNK